MSVEVKTAKLLKSQVNPSGFWLLYFISSIALLGWFFAYALTVPLCLLGRVFRPCWRWGGYTLTRGVRALLKVQPWLTTHISLQLPELAPTGPAFVTVSNHRSHLDMYLLLAHIRNVRAVTKASLFRVPFLAIMLRVMRMIGIKRGSIPSYLAAMEAAKAAVVSGDPVHIFPEGTRCEPGLRGTQPFQLMPFQMMKELGVKVFPIVFIGTDDAWPKGHNGVRFGSHVAVISLPAVDPKEFATADSLRTAVQSIIDRELAKHGS